MTRRRSRRESQRPSALSRAISALAGGSVFLASSYTPDGANIGAFVDLLDPTHTLVQATAGNQVLAPTSDSALRGKASTLFATGKTYVSNRAASTWKRLHDGTGGGMCLIWVPETVPASTSNCYAVSTVGAFSGAGVLFDPTYVTTPVKRYSTFVLKTGPVSVVTQNATTDQWTAGVGAAYRYTYTDGAGTPEMSVWGNGTLATSGDSATTPDTGNPVTSLTLGGTTVQNGWTWRFHALFVPPAAWTAAQVTAVSNYAMSLGLAGA